MAATTLFVIIDLSRDPQPALDRAAALARAGGGHIHAFCCVYEDDLSQYSSRHEGKREIRERAQQKLDAMLEALASDAVSAEGEVDWNEHWFESAVQACTRVGADLMVKSTFAHEGRVSKRSDHHILRHSPCPVLLTGGAGKPAYERVLAALALEDNDRKHDELNNRVIAQAQKVCRTSGANLHAVAALEGAPNIAQLLKITEDKDEERLSGEQMISESFGVDRDRVYIDYGPAKSVIVEMVEKSGADLLVIGTVARKGLSGAVVGNTCEKVLDALSIDVLTVA